MPVRRKIDALIFAFRRKRKLTEKKMWKIKATFLSLAVTLSITQVFSQLVSEFLSYCFCRPCWYSYRDRRKDL